MKIDFLTLFPDMFEGVLGSSILQKAQEKEAVQFQIVNFREYSDNKHNTVDDYPYGGGAGMVLKPQPVFDAVEDLTSKADSPPRVILVCPQGERFTQKKPRNWQRKSICCLSAAIMKAMMSESVSIW